MGIEYAVIMTLVAIFIAMIQFAIRMFLSHERTKLERKIDAVVAIPAFPQPQPELTLRQQYELDRKDHDKYRAQKKRWHTEGLADWQLDFEAALPEAERDVLIAEHRAALEDDMATVLIEDLDNDREPLYNDGNIVAWGGVQVPYFTAEETRRRVREQQKEYRESHERIAKAYERQIQALKDYCALKY
jgi:hypothetical protein